MFYSRLINRAIDIAYSAHEHQRDKAGRPYFMHPVIVASQMNSEYEICAALLHDVVEDARDPEKRLEEIEREFPKEITDAVKILTHDKHTDYMDYIREIKKNPIARKVKLADLNHNLDITRIQDNPKLLEGFLRRREKYEKAREILSE